ncbi:LPXTG-motif cell wall-anchored protein [Micromonospora luteifusca]|uniref:LPXTG-motif cell wall-anchored protein n=1 Tax=Micromonospora luteifusca TaxID=709860 RepID=A0ABS2LXN2_9ACTN|nr:cell wall anchor protein [Micromonospora luteifusca]MBM7492950.1 LPXTG-motif cell wall-anchored protein [Micromonospora luteifusca]
MNLPKSPLRRVAAIAAGALIGLTGVGVVASPASAHYSAVSGQAVCDTTTGEWVVTWTVESKAHYSSKFFRLRTVNLTPADTTVTNIKVSEPGKYPYDVNTPITGEQRVPGSATKATLAVKAKWDDGYPEDNATKGMVTFGGKCEKDTPPTTTPPTTPPPTTPTTPPVSPTPSPSVTTPPSAVTVPTASFASDCEGAVTVTLANGADATADAKLTVKATGFSQTYTVAPGASKSDIVVPAKAGAITVSEGDKTVGTPYTWATPEDCVKPGEPQAGFESTCDKLVFGFANPENGKAFEVTLTPNKGEVQKRTVEPGKTVVVEFAASEGLTVTPAAEGLDDTSPIAWEKPADCNAGQGGGDKDEPALPLTGAATGGIIAGAVVLLAAGAGLFVMARRRRVRFTA